MPKRPTISRGELDVARTVWELGEATVGQVFDCLSERKSIDYATVQTYLRRLESKRYLRTRRDGRRKLYRPRVGAGQVIREAVNDLVDQLFDGDALGLWQHLIRDQKISPQQADELRQILDAWEAKRHVR